jgi:hypothetical protein
MITSRRHSARVSAIALTGLIGSLTVSCGSDGGSARDCIAELCLCVSDADCPNDVPTCINGLCVEVFDDPGGRDVDEGEAPDARPPIRDTSEPDAADGALDAPEDDADADATSDREDQDTESDADGSGDVMEPEPVRPTGPWSADPALFAPAKPSVVPTMWVGPSTGLDGVTRIFRAPLDVGGSSVIQLAELDEDDDLEVLVGFADGYVRVLDRPWAGARHDWVVSGPLRNARSAPAFIYADLDGDGSLEGLSADGTIWRIEIDSERVEAVRLDELADPVNAKFVYKDVDDDDVRDLIIFSGTDAVWRRNASSPGVIQFGPRQELSLELRGPAFFSILDQYGGDRDDLFVSEEYGPSYVLFPVASFPGAPWFGNGRGVENILAPWGLHVAAGDMDGDGLQALVGISGSGRMRFWHRAPAESPTIWLRGETDAGALLAGESFLLADDDLDGDLDIWTIAWDGSVHRQANVGSPLRPRFGPAELVLSLSTFGSHLSRLDLVGDERADLVVGHIDGTLVLESRDDGYVETSSPLSPHFDDTVLDITYAQLDGTEVLYMNLGGRLFRIENPRTDPVRFRETADSIGDARFYAIDVDDDGTDELLLLHPGGSTRQWKRTAEGWDPQIGNAGTAEVGFRVSGAAGDLNGDGLLDILMSEVEGALHMFPNTGTQSVPVFEEDAGLASIRSSGRTRQCLAINDFDGDGRDDLLASVSGLGLSVAFADPQVHAAWNLIESLQFSGPLSLPFGMAWHTACDVDQDGDMDAIADDSGRIALFLQDDAGQFDSESLTLLQSFAGSEPVDIACLEPADGETWLVMMDARNRVTAARIDSAELGVLIEVDLDVTGAVDIGFHDVDRDGHHDAFFFNPDGDLMVSRSRGFLQFDEPHLWLPRFPVGAAPRVEVRRYEDVWYIVTTDESTGVNVWQGEVVRP